MNKKALKEQLTLLRKRLVSIFLLVILVSSFAAHAVQAQTTPTEPAEEPPKPTDYERYMGNDILWYDPNASCGVTSGPEGGTSGPCVLVGDDPDPTVKTAKQIGNFLIAKGLTVDQAAGVMGNIQAESGFRPGAVEGGSGIGFGIVQWSFGRRTALENAAREKGVDVADLCFQLEYLYQELTVRTADRPEYRQYGTEWKALQAMTSARDALVMFHHEFEISHLMNGPDPTGAVNAARGGFADRWLEVMKNEALGAGGGSNPGASCAQVPTGNLPKTLLAYAWPEYRGEYPYTIPERREPTPGWRNVINTYPALGRYIGGTDYPGIDCGGFVTNLVVDSGFDPNYNYRSIMAEGAGNTISQQRWLDANWVNLGKGGSFDVATLKQGDVAINSTHTFIYVGDVPGFASKIASASWDLRAPMADTAQNAADPDFTWYRKG